MVTDDYFHQSNLIEGFDSAKADECLKEAWLYLSKQDKLTKTVICKTQRIATWHQRDLQPTWRGNYRRIPVFIGGREAIKPAFIEQAMKNLLLIVDFTHPRTWHVEFEKIHPFVDGNGRTGRLLLWWMELKREQEPTLITYEDRQRYYRWFA